MPNSTTISLKTPGLDVIQNGLSARATAVLDKIALDVQGIAQQEANVDTGAMRASGYTSGLSGGSSYGASTGAARARRGKVKTVPEVKPAKPLERIVGFSVNYAYWVHVKHKPFLSMAVEQVRPKAEAAWKKLFE